MEAPQLSISENKNNNKIITEFLLCTKFLSNI
jgi:hypothetical protein